MGDVEDGDLAVQSKHRRAYLKGLFVELPISEEGDGAGSSAGASPSQSSPSLVPSNYSWDSVLMQLHPPPTPCPRKRSPQLRRGVVKLSSTPPSPSKGPPLRLGSVPVGSVSEVEKEVGSDPQHSWAYGSADSPTLKHLSDSVQEMEWVARERQSSNQQAFVSVTGWQAAAAQQQDSGAVTERQEQQQSLLVAVGQATEGLSRSDNRPVEDFGEEHRVPNKVAAVVLSSPAELLASPRQPVPSSQYSSIRLSALPQTDQYPADVTSLGMATPKLGSFCPPQIEIPPTPSNPSPWTSGSSQAPSSDASKEMHTSPGNSPSFQPITPSPGSQLPSGHREQSVNVRGGNEPSLGLHQPSAGPVPGQAAYCAQGGMKDSFHNSEGSQGAVVKQAHGETLGWQLHSHGSTQQKVAYWQQRQEEERLNEQRWEQEVARRQVLQQQEEIRQLRQEKEEREQLLQEQEEEAGIRVAVLQQEKQMQESQFTWQQHALQQKILEQQHLISQLQHDSHQRARYPEQLVLPAACPVCEQTLGCGRAIFAPECGHFVHFECIREKLRVGQSACPTCNRRIEQKPYMRTPASPSVVGSPAPSPVYSPIARTQSPLAHPAPMEVEYVTNTGGRASPLGPGVVRGERRLSSSGAPSAAIRAQIALQSGEQGSSGHYWG